MDLRIEERDEAGNLTATYVGSPSADGLGKNSGRVDVVVGLAVQFLLPHPIELPICGCYNSSLPIVVGPIETQCTYSLLFGIRSATSRDQRGERNMAHVQRQTMYSTDCSASSIRQTAMGSGRNYFRFFFRQDIHTV